MAILKAVLYILAVLFLVGGGLCAATAVFVPADGMGEIMALALVVMLVSFVVMKLVGRPKFAAGSAGEAVLYFILFLFFGMPLVQGLAYTVGLGMAAPYVSLAALVAVVAFLLRRYGRQAKKQAMALTETPPIDPPPPQA